MGRNIILFILSFFCYAEDKPKPVVLEDKQAINAYQVKALNVVIAIKESERQISEAEKAKAIAQLEIEHKQNELASLNAAIQSEVNKLVEKYKVDEKIWQLNDKFEWERKKVSK